MIIGKPVPESGWFSIPNTTAQDSALSLRARGLLSLILSHKSGANLTVENLATFLKEGEGVIGKAMKELVDSGYVARVRYQIEGGRWAMETFAGNSPDVTRIAVAQWRTEQNPGSHRVPGFPGVGETGYSEPRVPGDTGGSVDRGLKTKKEQPKKKTQEEDQQNPTPRPPLQTEPHQSAPSATAGAEATGDRDDPSSGAPATRRQEEEPMNTTHRQDAVAVVDVAARHHGLTLTPAQRANLTDDYTAAINDGWTTDALKRVLARPLNGADNPAAAFASRLQPKNLGAPPPPPPVMPPWCGQCDEGSRKMIIRVSETEDAIQRCPRCHPDAAKPMSDVEARIKTVVPAGFREARAELRPMPPATRDDTTMNDTTPGNRNRPQGTKAEAGNEKPSSGKFCLEQPPMWGDGDVETIAPSVRVGEESP